MSISKYEVVPFKPDWYDPTTGWLTGALQDAIRVPSDKILTGLYTDAMLPPGSCDVVTSIELCRFEIRQNLVIQYTNTRQIHITQFEVKVFDLKAGGTPTWLETWARYMDGIKPIWVKESANINYKFPVPKGLMPVNQAAFFRKVFRDLRGLHCQDFIAPPDTATRAGFELYFKRMGVNLHRLVAPLKSPDAALTPKMADFCLKLNDFENSGPLNVAQARKLVTELSVLWFLSTGQLGHPNDRSRNSEDLERDLVLMQKIESTLQSVYPNPTASSSK